MVTLKKVYSFFIISSLVVSFISFPVNYTSAQGEGELISCPSISTLEAMRVPLRYRMKNKHVGTLQRTLACLGYLNPENITNFYGKFTVEAARDFFSDVNLRGTGRIFSKVAKKYLISEVKNLSGELEVENQSYKSDEVGSQVFELERTKTNKPTTQPMSFYQSMENFISEKMGLPVDLSTANFSGDLIPTLIKEALENPVLFVETTPSVGNIIQSYDFSVEKVRYFLSQHPELKSVLKSILKDRKLAKNLMAGIDLLINKYPGRADQLRILKTKVQAEAKLLYLDFYTDKLPNSHPYIVGDTVKVKIFTNAAGSEIWLDLIQVNSAYGKWWHGAKGAMSIIQVKPGVTKYDAEIYLDPAFNFETGEYLIKAKIADASVVKSSGLFGILAPSKQSNPYIKIFSPTRGQVLNMKDLLKINWETNFPSSTWVYIYLYKLKKGETGTTSWVTIPIGAERAVYPGYTNYGHSGFYVGDFIKEPGEYRFEISNNPNKIPSKCLESGKSRSIPCPPPSDFKEVRDEVEGIIVQ